MKTGIESNKAKDFSYYLFQIIEGKRAKFIDANGYDDLIELPENLICYLDKKALINKVYP